MEELLLFELVLENVLIFVYHVLLVLLALLVVELGPQGEVTHGKLNG